MSVEEKHFGKKFREFCSKVGDDVAVVASKSGFSSKNTGMNWAKRPTPPRGWSISETKLQTAYPSHAHLVPCTDDWDCEDSDEGSKSESWKRLTAPRFNLRLAGLSEPCPDFDSELATLEGHLRSLEIEPAGAAEPEIEASSSRIRDLFSDCCERLADVELALAASQSVLDQDHHEIEAVRCGEKSIGFTDLKRLHLTRAVLRTRVDELLTRAAKLTTWRTQLKTQIDGIDRIGLAYLDHCFASPAR